MATEYSKMFHTYVTLKGDGDEYDGTFQIINVVGKGDNIRVWIGADYHLMDAPGFIVVGDGLTNGLDEDGECVISVSANAIAGFWTDEEGESIEQARQVDEFLLACAR
jgi:hypothetical protein